MVSSREVIIISDVTDRRISFFPICRMNESVSFGIHPSICPDRSRDKKNRLRAGIEDGLAGLGIMRANESACGGDK